MPLPAQTIDDANVMKRVASGRARWKIENENNNTLKTKGYQFEHNFGHGQQFLSALLATLILLAYLLHTLLDLMGDKFCLLRQKLPSRQRLFDDMKALTTYWCFDSWEHWLDLCWRDGLIISKIKSLCLQNLSLDKLFGHNENCWK